MLDDVSVNLWHSFQQRKLVVAKTNLDLIANVRAVHANESRLPQRQDTAADIGINLSESVRGARIHRGRLNLVAAPHCGRDVLLHIEHCATTSFRWVCGQNRDDLNVVHHVRNRAAGNLGVAKLLPCCLQRGVLRWIASIERCLDAQLLVQILSEVGQKCEVRESTDDRACLGWVNIAEEAGELLDVAIATMEFEGCTASIFDQVKDLVTLLLADYLPKNSTQVANILPEQVLLLRGSGR